MKTVKFLSFLGFICIIHTAFGSIKECREMFSPPTGVSGPKGFYPSDAENMHLKCFVSNETNCIISDYYTFEVLVVWNITAPDDISLADYDNYLCITLTGTLIASSGCEQITHVFVGMVMTNIEDIGKSQKVTINNGVRVPGLKTRGAEGDMKILVVAAKKGTKIVEGNLAGAKVLYCADLDYIRIVTDMEIG